MQILDGKNHTYGDYEKFALDIILEVLNTGRHWGWLSFPPTSTNYPPEDILRADAVFLKTFRELVDQWIDSGIEDGIETPSKRYVRGLPAGYSKSLFDILHEWLTRNTPKPALLSNGKIGILDRRPEPYGLTVDEYARETAIYYLKELLECPAPHRLGRCTNSKCRSYFVRRRERKTEIKRGAYCGKCELTGSAERTKLSRQYRKKQMLDTAARAWLQWTKNNKRPIREDWVAGQVNKQFVGSRIQRKWITQNQKAILERLTVKT